MHRRLTHTLQRQLAIWERERSRRLTVRAGDALAREFAFFGEGAVLMHPWRLLGNTQSVSIGARTKIRQGIHFEALAPSGTVIIDIGPDCHLASNIRIVAVNGVVIEEGSAVADNVFLADTIHDYLTVEDGAPNWTAGLKLGAPLVIRRGSGIGTNCVVTGGIEIGENAIVAPCTVVSRDVPANSLVVGNPAYVQRVRRPDGGWDWVADQDRRDRPTA